MRKDEELIESLTHALLNIERMLPDPYSHPQDHYFVRVPMFATLPVIDPMSVSETAEIMDKTAIFEKATYVTKDGRRLKKWRLISFQ